MNEHITDS